MKKIIIGIDPGLTGGIVKKEQGGKILSYCSMPLQFVRWKYYTNKKGQRDKSAVNELDLQAIRKIIYTDVESLRNTVVGIERQQAMVRYENGKQISQGVASTFKTGYNFGLLLGLFEGLRVPYYKIQARVWKKHFGLDNDKNKSRELALKMSGENFTVKKTPDHNICEAFLIAEYAESRLDEIKDEK